MLESINYSQLMKKIYFYANKVAETASYWYQVTESNMELQPYLVPGLKQSFISQSSIHYSVMSTAFLELIFHWKDCEIC